MRAKAEIYCAGCGKLYEVSSFGMGWIESLSHTRVCSKECKDKLALLYARVVTYRGNKDKFSVLDIK